MSCQNVLGTMNVLLQQVMCNCPECLKLPPDERVWTCPQVSEQEAAAVGRSTAGGHQPLCPSRHCPHARDTSLPRPLTSRRNALTPCLFSLPCCCSVGGPHWHGAGERATVWGGGACNWDLDGCCCGSVAQLWGPGWLLLCSLATVLGPAWSLTPFAGQEMEDQHQGR